MSDYYSHRDRDKTDHRAGYPDYADTDRGGTWLWVAVVLVALVALIGAGLAGGGSGTAPDGAVIDYAPTGAPTGAPTAPPDAAAPAVPPVD